MRMKLLLAMLVATLLFPAFLHAQYTYKIKADSVRITNDSCNAELIVENATRNVKGFLYNKGYGRTEFRKGMLKLNDSLYVFGDDTLNVSSVLRNNTNNNSSGNGNYIWNQKNIIQSANFNINGVANMGSLIVNGPITTDATANVMRSHSLFNPSITPGNLYQTLVGLHLNPTFNGSLGMTYDLLANGNIGAKTVYGLSPGKFDGNNTWGIVSEGRLRIGGPPSAGTDGMLYINSEGITMRDAIQIAYNNRPVFSVSTTGALTTGGYSIGQTWAPAGGGNHIGYKSNGDGTIIVQNVPLWLQPYSTNYNSQPVYVGNVNPAGGARLQVEGALRVSGSTTSPIGANGTFNYNTSTNQFEGYRNGSWKNFLMEGDAPTSNDYIQNQYLAKQQAKAWIDTIKATSAFASTIIGDSIATTKTYITMGLNTDVSGLPGYGGVLWGNTFFGQLSFEYERTTNRGGWSLQNTAYGYRTLENMKGGSQNTAVGFYTGQQLTTGNGNTLLGGRMAGHTITTGDNNTMLGSYATGVVRGHNNTFIGYNTQVAFDSIVNTTILGNNITGIVRSNAQYLGRADQITFIQGQTLIGDTTLSIADGFKLYVNGKGKFTDQLVLHNNTSDLTGSYHGGMYYNTSSNQFRGYRNGVWKNFLMEGDIATPATPSLQQVTNVGNTTTNAIGLGVASPTEQLDMSGNLKMVNTTTSTGMIYKGNSSFIHNYTSSQVASPDAGSNTFVGIASGNRTMSASAIDNVGLGKNTLRSLNGGSSNIAIGSNSLYSNSSGLRNIAIGYNALYSNTTGVNIAIGYNTLYSNTEGFSNLSIGDESLYSNTTGQFNIGIGLGTLRTNTTGRRNIAIGFNALYANTTSQSNLAIGFEALKGNTIGEGNTAIGNGSMISNINGYLNTALGEETLTYNTSGNSNIAIGKASLFSNISGSANTAIGNSALRSNTTGTYNTAIGGFASQLNTTGSNNTAIGSAALQTNTSGIYNTALGYSAGALTTGSYNIIIGSYISTAIENGNRQLNIGNVLYGINMYNIGGTHSSSPVLDGKIGIGLTTPTARLHLPAGTTAASMAPLKFTAGSNMSTPENGAMEFDGSNYYLTASSIRDTIATRSWVSNNTAAASQNIKRTLLTANTTLTASHYYTPADAAGGAFTIQLPDAATCTNRVYKIKKVDTSTNGITIDAYSAQTIDGQQTITLATQWQVITIVSNGSNWEII